MDMFSARALSGQGTFSVEYTEHNRCSFPTALLSSLEEIEALVSF
jgi:hypothetical protein